MEELIAALPWTYRTTTLASATRSRAFALESVTVALAYLVIALLLRGFTFGSPVVHIDEQFYLLVGDRILHGALPYIDIWDRKPIGLFLLFAGFRLLGGEGLIQYQVAAMLAALAGALIVYRLACRIASRAGAWWAGVAYLLYLSAFNCFGGQATVYYNPLVALAALLLCDAWTVQDTTKLLRRGVMVMALIGLAIQIKYTVVFEGLAFGLALIVRGWNDGWSLRRLALTALLWCFVALFPTVLALAYYVALGHGQAFFYANFLSIFGREEPWGPSFARLAKETAALSGFWLALFVAPKYVAPTLSTSDENALSDKRRDEVRSAQAILRYWGIAAVAGFLVFGTWYDHYVTPLLAPLCVLAAPMLGSGQGEGVFIWRGAGKPWRRLRLALNAQITTLLLIGFGTYAAIFMTYTQMREHGTRAQIMHAAALMRSHMGNGCAYINEGDPILYLFTNSCFVSRYVFPNHLAGMDEAHGTGVNVAQEIARIMATHPSVVMMSPTGLSKPVNWQTRAILLAALARDYTPYAEVQVGNRSFDLYSLKHNATQLRP